VKFTPGNEKAGCPLFPSGPAMRVLTGHLYRVYRVLEIKGQAGHGKDVIELNLTENNLF
jgi:hypothetical protein